MGQLNLKKTLAGEDPEWRQKLIRGYTDCYQVASNWPQQSLDRNPITKVFGRHMIFFKCAKTRKENVRDGSDVLLADHPLWQQRRLQLEPVWTSPGQVRPGRSHRHGPDRGFLQGGQVHQRLLHQRRAVNASYKDLILKR